MEDDDYWDGFPTTLSTAHVAQMLGLSRGTVVVWLKAGTLPAHFMGGSWIIFKAELGAFIESRSNRADAGVLAPVDVLADYPKEMTYRDLMECLGKTKQTIYSWLRTGVVPAFQIGDHWVMHKHRLARTLEQASNRPEE